MTNALATVTTETLKKGFDSLEAAYTAGVPRGNHDLDAEIMLFAIADQEVSPTDALEFAYRLSAAVSSARTADVAAEMLESQKEVAAQLDTTRARLRDAIAFIKARGLFDDFEAGNPTKAPRKTRESRKADQAAQVSPPAAGTGDPATIVENHTTGTHENRTTEESSSHPAGEPQPGAETAKPHDNHTTANPAETNANPASTPEAEVAAGVVDPGEKSTVNQLEGNVESAPANPQEAGGVGEGDLLGDKPSAYNFLTGEDFLVNSVIAICTYQTTAEAKASVNPGSQVFVLPGEIKRVTPGGGSVAADQADGNAYVVAMEAPDAEYVACEDRFVKNLGYVPPEVDED